MTPLALLVFTLVGLIGIGAGLALCCVAAFYGWEKRP